MIKIVSFFEEHIEKVILAVVGLVCLWPLYHFVVLGPNRFLYDKKKFSPGTIDKYISKQAELLKQKLQLPPDPPRAYEPNLPKFSALLDSAVSNVDTKIYIPQPYSSSVQTGGVERTYNLPQIPEVNEPVVERIRAVAYVPAGETTEQIAYESAKIEPNDIDLVTVEAKFDVAELYRRFQESFASEDVRAEWRDPCLAKPVFAATQLERQEALGDGTWSQWQTVPRIKIDPLRNLLATIQNIDPGSSRTRGGLKLWILQFDNRQVAMNLLQPAAYQIASAKEEWFPPSLHKKFVKLQKEQQLEEKRKALEEENQAARDEKMDERRSRSGQTRPGRESLGGTPYEGSGSSRSGSSGSQTRTSRSRTDRSLDTTLSPTAPTGRGGLRDTGRPRDSSRSTDTSRLTDTARQPRRGERQGTTEIAGGLPGAPEAIMREPIDEVSDELYKIIITDRTDFARMRQPLVFWAHDETAEPKKTYRYRIRLGVFNPVAAADQFSSRAKDAILWSEFSPPTEPVQVSGTLYLFAKDLQEAAKIVTVQVSKFRLGRWYSQDFAVRQGESIGKVVETTTEVGGRDVPTRLGAGSAGVPTGRDDPRGIRTAPGPVPPPPEIIDYSCRAVLVDVMPVDDWSGGRSMVARHYFDMLYSFDGIRLERTAIGTKYWAADLRATYAEIQNLQKQPPEPLRSWGSGTPAGLRPTVPGSRYRESGEYDERMIEERMRMEEMRKTGRTRY
jgi:hypothetical protein